jgi:hypothetical protein
MTDKALTLPTGGPLTIANWTRSSLTSCACIWPRAT